VLVLLASRSVWVLLDAFLGDDVATNGLALLVAVPAIWFFLGPSARIT